MADEYRISSIADFLLVPYEKQSDCLRDFETWLNMARKHVEVVALMTDLLGNGLRFDNTIFYWIDDGVEGVSAIQLNDDGSDRTMRLHMKEPI